MPRVQADDYDAKKSKILDAAASLFADRGYAGSRMDEIAKACGVSKSMLYHYFKKKEDVLADILQEHVSRLIESISSRFRCSVLGSSPGRTRSFHPAISASSISAMEQKGRPKMPSAWRGP